METLRVYSCARRALLFAVAGLFGLLSFAGSAAPQGIRRVLYARSRVFLAAAKGVSAIKTDSSGRYYILAKPPNTIEVYGADGAPVGRIPAGLGGATQITYATDFDIDADGHILVADRGANTVEIFSASGALIQKIPVFAPVSVAALSDSEFAVVTLRAEAPIQIMNEQGKLIRKFGGSPHSPEASAAISADGNPPQPPSLAEPGAIARDSNGHLYYAVASGSTSPDPAILRYDRYGFVSFEASLPPAGPAPEHSSSDDRIQFGFNFSQMGFSDQFSSWATVGTSGRVNFGSSVGMGFRSLMGGPGGGPAGYGGPLVGSQGGPGPFSGGPNGPNSFSAMNLTSVAGQGSFEHGQFHFGVGLGSNRARGGGRRGGGASASSSGDSTPLLGNILQFGSDDSTSAASNSSAYLSASPDADGDLSANLSTVNGDSVDAILAGGQSSSSTLAPSDLAGSPTGLGFIPHGGFGGGFGGGFHDGMHPPGFGGSFGALGTPDGRFTNGESFNQFVPGSFVSNGPGTTPHFRLHGEIGPDTISATASVRVNLDRPNKAPEEKETVTAIGVDPNTQETWATMGTALVRIDKDGNVLDTFYLAAPDGTTLRPTAIVVEPSRLIVATDFLGVFEFARPDQATSTGAVQTAPPQKSSAPQQ